jgi:hypothetical protein
MVLAKRDMGIILTALTGAAISMVSYSSGPLGVAHAMLPLIALIGWSLFPQLVNLKSFAFVTVLAACVVFLDESYNNPFYEGNPPSELLGPLLFDRWQILFDLPGMQFTTFELLTIFSALGFFIYRRCTSNNHGADKVHNLMRVMALALPIACATAVAYGLWRGQDMAMAMTQNRFMPVLSAWIYLGYCAYQQPENATRLFKILTAVDFGFKMDSREYLMEHITSESIAMAMVFIGYTWWHKRRHLGDDILAIFAIVIMMGPYLLNLRRTSYIGLALTGILLPVLYRQAVKIRHLIIAAALACTAASVVVATWNTPGPLGAFSRPVKRFLNPPPPGEFDYRDVENYNNYRSIMDHPLSGRGFGISLARYLPLLDISTVYPLYEIVPHNNILFLWSHGGPLTMAAFATTAAIGIAVCVRLSRKGQAYGTRLLGFIGWGMIVRWLIFCWADLGLAFFRLPAITGLVLGMSLRALFKSDKGVSRAEVKP